MVDGAQRARRLMALHPSGVPLCPPWTPQPLQPWEGPFAGPNKPLPQPPEVKAERSAALKRWRERQKAARITAAAAEAA